MSNHPARPTRLGKGVFGKDSSIRNFASMTSNYFVLAAVVRELERAMQSASFVEAFSQRPDELRIVLNTGDNIVAILKPIHGALFLSHRPKLPRSERPKKN